MKTKKLNLNDLKVESFVTNIDGRDAQTVKGGSQQRHSGNYLAAAVIDTITLTVYAAMTAAGYSVVDAARDAVVDATKSGNSESESDKK